MRKKSSQTKWIWVATGLCVATCITIFLELLWLPVSLDEGAKGFAEGCLAGSPGRFASLVPDQLKSAYGWDNRDVNRFCSEFVRPKLSGYRFGERHAISIAPDGSFAGYAKLIEGRTRNDTYRAVVKDTPRGPELDFNNYLARVWLTEWAAKHRVSDLYLDTMRSFIAGIERDRTRLEQLHVPGLLNDSGELVPWQALLDRNRAQLVSATEHLRDTKGS